MILPLTAALALFNLLLVAPTSGAPAPSDAIGPIVDLGYAAFMGNATTPTGVEDGPVVFFGGIPFAEPPLGDLRWREPKMLNESIPDHPVNLSDARNYASPCIPQPAVTGVGSEDCLYLNVWMPVNATNTSSFPVAFWIYGGGFFAGNTASYPMYDWVAQNPGIVAVSVSYRLASLGFLAGPGIAADGDYNIGLLDQRAGMEWVQRHIRAFGGDPDEVTIIGESAGAAAVVMQITGYGGNQTAPFKRAVVESIGYGPGDFAVSDATDAIFTNFTASVGCSTDIAPTEIMACLRNATLESIIFGINNQTLGALSPVYGDAFVPDIPSQLFRDGRFTPVEYMGGHCSGDGHTFSNGSPTETLSEADIVSEVFTGRWIGVTNETIQEVFDFYPKVNSSGSPLHSYYDLGSEIGGDIVFSCMDEFIAGHMLDAGVKNVFTFVWNAPNPIAYASAPYQWAAHGSDVFFLFSGTNGGTFVPFNASEAILAEQAVGYWTSFAATGNPSTHRAPNSLTWPHYMSSDRQKMVFTRGDDAQTESTVGLWSDYKTSRCEWWFQQNVTAQTAV